MKNSANTEQMVYIVDDDQEILILLSGWLGKAGYRVEVYTSGEAALTACETRPPQLVITDLYMGGIDGLEVLSGIHKRNPLLPVILLSGKARIPDAVKATHLGCAAFLTKPVERQEFLYSVRRYLRVEENNPVHLALASSIIYRSEIMQRLVDVAEQIADSNVTVCITGATGTGKEVFARALHRASPRRNQPFVAINCGAIPEQLLESELFGHEKGAFSGAISRHEGLFQAASGGTLFLDEIGDMPLSLQVKLLRVLEDFEVRPVGSTRSYPIDVRLISATHQDLEQRVRQGVFREDLYYRLKVVPLSLPALVDRREDIPLLIDHFLSCYAMANHRTPKRFSPDAVDYLVRAPWPGNVRQLINVIELCATLCKTDIIPLALVQSALHDNRGTFQTLKEARQEFERNYLVGVLRIANGQVSGAARLAGRNRTEFYKLLGQHGLDPAEFRNRQKNGNQDEQKPEQGEER